MLPALSCAVSWREQLAHSMEEKRALIAPCHGLSESWVKMGSAQGFFPLPLTAYFKGNAPKIVWEVWRQIQPFCVGPDAALWGWGCCKAKQ